MIILIMLTCSIISIIQIILFILIILIILVILVILIISIILIIVPFICSNQFYFICFILLNLFYFISFQFILFQHILTRLPSFSMNCGICTDRKWKYQVVSLFPFIFGSCSRTLVEVYDWIYPFLSLRPFCFLYFASFFSFNLILFYSNFVLFYFISFYAILFHFIFNLCFHFISIFNISNFNLNC